MGDSRTTPPLRSDAYINYSPHYPLLDRKREPLSGEPPPPVFSEPRYILTGSPRTVETVQETTNITSTTTESPPPPPRSRTGLIVGIIVGLIILGVIGFLVYYFFLRNRNTTTTGTGTGTAAPVLNEACSASNPCATIFTCVNGFCKSNTNGPCIADTDCSQATFTHECTGTGGQGGQCRRPNGVGCTNAPDCLSGFCLAGTCMACTLSTECQPNQTCQSGVCQ